MNTTVFCKHARTTRDTLRYYEELGILVPKRHSNNYREYDENDLRTYKIISNLKSVGLKLDEISQLLILRDQPITSNCQNEVLKIIQNKADYFKLQSELYGNLTMIANTMYNEIKNDHQEKVENLINSLGDLYD